MTKRVLLVPDTENWAWHKRAKSLQKYAPDDIDVDIVMQRDFKQDMPDRYDGTLVFSWPDSPVCDNRVWTFVANEGLMYRHNPEAPNYVERTASRGKNIDTAKKRIPRFRGVITINHRTVDFLCGLNDNVHLLDTGVDLEVYRPIKPVRTEPPYRIGWCGKSFDDPKLWTPKGYHEVLLPLMELFKGDDRIEWVINRNHAENALSESEMVEWYNGIDMLLVTSAVEGTPSTYLEAMACGRLTLATNVGIVQDTAMKIADAMRSYPSMLLPEIHRSWHDAESAERIVELLAVNINSLLETGDPHHIHSACWASRKVCEQHYNWNRLAERWLRTILT